MNEYFLLQRCERDNVKFVWEENKGLLQCMLANVKKIKCAYHILRWDKILEKNCSKIGVNFKAWHILLLLSTSIASPNPSLKSGN